MAIEVITRDCTALGDAELGAMADLSASSAGWEAGLLSKQAEEWVLVSEAFDKNKLRGFVFTTLERIGGTPSLVIGVGCVGRVRNRASVLRGLMHDQYHKALMAFPDEDVIVATRMADGGAFEGMSELTDCRPWPDVRPNGEERAWGRRLAKRFGTEHFDDRTMTASGGVQQLLFDHESTKACPSEAAFSHLGSDEFIIGWGWAMAEFLDKFEKPAS